VDTLRQYSGKVVRLAAMLLRESDHYFISLPQDIVCLLVKLREILLASNTTNTLGHAIHKLLIAIWTREWLPTEKDPISDPTIRFLALSSVDVHGGFRDAKEITNPIAALEYCMRLTFLVEIHLQSKKHKKNSYAIAAKELSHWYIEKFESTFNSLRTLQHRATAIAYATPSLPRLWWVDPDIFHIMMYEGNKITFDDLSKVFNMMEKDLITSWEDNVLLGLKLHIDYDELYDDISNTTVGYSFLEHSQNLCFRNRDQLVTAIVNDQELSKQFLCDQTGPDGGVLWNVLQLRSWLSSYAEFAGILMARVEMTAGSPARGTEVACLEYRNTPTRQGRGLYVMGKFLATLCRYHKSQNNTMQDKLIPHALDGLCSDLIVQDLAIARPFAELASYICFPNKPEIQACYRTFLFVKKGELFDTPKLSAYLKHYTEAGLGYGAGVNSWRHISIGFRRQLCPRIFRMMENNDNEMVAALQAAHSVQTERRLYGLSDESMLVESHIHLQHFLDASTDWQNLCRIVPGGQMLPYNQARGVDYHDPLKNSNEGRTHMGLTNANLTYIVDHLKPAISSMVLSLNAEKFTTQFGPLLDDMISASISKALSKCHKFIDILPIK
jgi:hypothetical protein